MRAAGVVKALPSTNQLKIFRLNRIYRIRARLLQALVFSFGYRHHQAQIGVNYSREDPLATADTTGIRCSISTPTLDQDAQMDFLCCADNGELAISWG